MSAALFSPFRLRELTLENRVVVSPMDMYSAQDGMPNDFHLVHLGARALGGAALLMTEMVCVSPEARITLGCTGLYTDEHRDAWKRIVSFVHEWTDAKVCLQVGHSGRKGSTKLPWEGTDIPLESESWERVGPSPITYGPTLPPPREMTRADMDKFALRSHELAIQAIDEGRLPEEIVPVTISSKKGDTTVEVDEAPRRESTLESLSKLRGAFNEDGAHTAGNAPGVNDGAGALVLSSDDWAKANGRTPLATIVAQAAVADEFPYLARTPANAAKKALEAAGLSVDDIDIFEINEAFASVALNSMRMLGADESKVNPNGGAIALGHPIGASGARILTTLVHELRRRGGGLGCAAICSGGGQGDAVIVEVSGS